MGLKKINVATVYSIPGDWLFFRIYQSISAAYEALTVDLQAFTDVVQTLVF